jgi:N-acetylglucosaminyldiphosphoundecaprenol N-acetyl-beta-D-mannosaminyltransferase
MANCNWVTDIDFYRGNVDELSEILLDRSIKKIRTTVHLVNMYTLHLARIQQDILGKLIIADFCLSDSRFIQIKLKRALGISQIRGADLFKSISRRGMEINLGHFFIGGKDSLIDHSLLFMRKSLGNIRVTGWEAPWINDFENFDWEGLARKIEETNSNFVWVGLGTPKQDLAVHRLAQYLSIPIIPIGGVFDIWSGETKAAPRYFSKLGIEWLFRLVQEPKRLASRYFGEPSKTFLRFLFLRL